MVMQKSGNFIAAMSALGLVMTAACKEENPPEPPASLSASFLDDLHYKCYGISDAYAESVGVDFLNQFAHEQGPLGTPLSFCTPVIKITKEGEHGTLSATDLKCYAFRGSDPDATVSLKTKQFGTEVHDVLEAIAICAPANMAVVPNEPSQSLTRSPYYTCYRIEGDKPDHDPVDLKTRPFPLEKQVTVNEPWALCAPSVKDPKGTEEEQQEQLRRAEEAFPHLKCYGIEGPPLGMRLNLLTIFGPERNVSVNQPQGFCVPVKKEVLPKVEG